MTLLIRFFLCLSSLLWGEEKRSKYFIAIKPKEEGALEHLDVYTPLVAPIGRFYADPFLFEYQDVHYLFFEDADYKKGVISYVTLDEEGSPSEVKPALELPIHLSFPYVFEEGGTIYMMPETYAARSVSLYRSVQFPDVWEKERVLVKGERFSDPILFKHGGYYWLFVAAKMEQLRIYYAKDLRGPFSPHPINRSHTKGRNAGPVFFQGDRLIRPVMDCTGKYGRAVIFKEILLLTSKEFKEREVGSIEPNWAPGLVGTHTYCQTEKFFVYDGERMIGE